MTRHRPMFKINNSFLRSKFARRIFLLFIVSAVIPVAVVAWLSYSHISKQLNKQSYEQSHIVCQAVGMELYRRLTIAHDELAAIGKRLEESASRGEKLSDNMIDANAPDFEELSLFVNGARTLDLRGTLDQPPELDDEQRNQLAEGKTVIQTRYDRENRLDILLIQALDENGRMDDLLVGIVDPDFIWAVNDMLPSANDVLILTPNGTVLHRSRPSLQAMIPSLMPLLATSISGHLEWTLDGEKNQASYWAVFTQDLFASPDLIVVVSQPESIALAPIRNFRSIYIPLLLVAILCVSFISAKQIRKKLVPLVSLRDATQRIASGNFTDRVTITTNDEFAALGDAFNIMAVRLETQFTSLSAMAEIDRLILSSFDARFIISTVLGRAGELAPCSIAAVLEIDEDDPSAAKLSIRRNMSEASIEENQVRLSGDEIDQLCNNPSQLQYKAGLHCPSYLTTSIGDGAQTILLLPTFIKKRLSTVLIFGFSVMADVNTEEGNALRKFADHMAVALSNAGWEERLYHQAHYDALTNLPNRALLKDRLEQAIARAQRNHSYVGVLFLDLDRFKLVNDSLGHAVGDIVLKKVADILTGGVRSVDTVVRFGGDEFIIIIPDIDSDGNAVFELGAIADKIFEAAQNEFEIDRQTVHPKMSIGIALYPKDGMTPEELIKNADAAMYHAKSEGRARYEFFAPELNAVASHRLQLEQDLRRALARNEFLLNFQPKIDCYSGSLLGAEALIRWRHPEKGNISPVEFIGVAEETGLIRDIGEWVMRNTCEQIVAWRAAGFDPVAIAVNVSPNQFREENFITAVTDILSQTRLETDMLELEITETTFMVDMEESIAKLSKCRDMGLRISLDDFGTGYSSLSYLRRLPLHTLKIDKSFIDTIDEEEDTNAIVAATIILAHKLGLKVVAEGVETEEQRRLLQHMQCDVLQGYLISKPLTPEQFAKRFLHTNSGSRAEDPRQHNHLRNAAS
jgi:diguanylate cyclase (GGDEF)-like protein